MIKRGLDFFLALAAFLFFLPVGVFICALIKIESKGSCFFCQRRLGLHGNVFTMFKFRTMREGSEHLGTGLFSYQSDPRVTKVGAILRDFSLDELPQLINVIMGSMSLVGPRPPVTYELGSYEDIPERWKKRFTVKPGITGLAQVSGRNDLSWPEKVERDLLYVDLQKEHGVWIDISIILRTVLVVLSRSNVVEKER